ncbi:CopG family ribbon-helix-helix protein [Rhodohalobacter sulfatireducens]|uniref:Ribbon-helix-helix domain-containing protein n=1 Tax=Rhodohalobacter sulfatireducens TaxID=2911366 RepID=A0ABS9KAX4_9BACT|nr:CopG family transcriptional regulator [Rhodohalobacter sulfatireducens]MCG2588009.1 ribbon-helix-helix domain-containing protein [Rhodohalobacter sulfatireducens]
MRSVRLPDEIEKELKSLAEQKKVSRSNIIKEALVEYISKEKKYNRPYDIGEEYFGKRGSGEKDRSTTYKSRIKEKIREKQSD